MGFGARSGHDCDRPTSLLKYLVLPLASPFWKFQMADQGAKSSKSSSLCFSRPVLTDSPMPPSFRPRTDYTSSSTSSPLSRAGFPSSARMDGPNSGAADRGRGPAFMGQVFSMCDPSGTGLMAVTNHLQIPFLPKRAPEWIKEVLGRINKSDDGPVFRFFMDLGDAVSYVKQLNIPTGVVGACRLDVAYEHFKEKPHMFQFVPNHKQVKAANRLLKRIPQRSGRRQFAGVPVFTAQNLNIAIATTAGIKWYTPYFFDKALLDNILEASTDQHFNTLIQSRYTQRRRNGIDDSGAAEVIEENGDGLFEPPEVLEVLEEMGQAGVPLNVISKAAEIQLLDFADRLLLGNRWLRKATGIQPKFPYLVDSFEERSARSFCKDLKSTSMALGTGKSRREWQVSMPGCKLNEGSDICENQQTEYTDSHLPFDDGISNPWSKFGGEQGCPDNKVDAYSRVTGTNLEDKRQIQPNPLLPNITMIGISTSEVTPISRANLKKTMEELSRELQSSSQQINKLNQDKDPLFVANVGDYSGLMKTTSV